MAYFFGNLVYTKDDLNELEDVHMQLHIIEKDLRNRHSEGFFCEVNGDSLLARRINGGQWDVTFESKNGRTYTETMRIDEIMRVLDDMGVEDEQAIYTPHYSSVRWSPEKVDKFMRGLPPQMCKPGFLGFRLTAAKANDFVVFRQPNRIDWFVDGKITDLKGVLEATRNALAEDVYWEYSEL